MKYWAIILTVYFLGLACFPCVDGEMAHVSQNTETMQMDQVEKTHHHATESCTPFCQCQCCQTIVVVAETFSFEPVLHPNYHQPVNYQTYFPNTSLSGLLQPPQHV